MTLRPSAEHSTDMTTATTSISLDENIRAALDWLVRSEALTGGSRAYCHSILGWSAAYPETTGYIVPTLLNAGVLLKSDRYVETGLRMGQWLLTLQDEEGWFPGGLYRHGQKGTASVFNTGQILFGLVALHLQTEDEAYKAAADRAINWLETIQQADGSWILGAYLSGHCPSYYAHVAWPIALYAKTFASPRARAIALKALVHIDTHRLSDGTYAKWAFTPGKPAPTHTMAYTMQGAIEASLLLDEWAPAGEHAAESMTILMRKYELRKTLAGAYGVGWKETSWYKCLTGHCQLASGWLRLFERTRDPRYLNVASKAIDEVAALQNLSTGDPDKKGAFAGSSPVWGRYMFMRYPNWAAKFFVDAALDLQNDLGSLDCPSK
jgi:hypothetical protein